MTRRSWEPLFIADIPDTWEVKDADGIVEAFGYEEAVQVSVLRREASTDPTELEARAVAAMWSANLGLKPTIRSASFDDRAVATFDITKGRWRGRVRWCFRTVVTPSGAVRVSLNQVRQAIGSAVGEEVFRSVSAYPADEPLDAAMYRRFGEGWRTGPLLGEAAVAAFEQQHAIALPEPFRTFVRDVANGAVGPPEYGLLELGETSRMSAGSVGPGDLARPFPLVDAWIWEDDDAASLEAIDAARRFGILPLGTDGDGQDFVLVASGPSRGQVWEITDVGAVPVAADFGAWVRG